jgi:Zn-dependent protease
VHWSFLALLCLVALADDGRGVRFVVVMLAWVVALFACVVVHELAHCVVARRRGARVIRIVLLPIGGLSQLESMPNAPDDEFAIAAAGPLTSLALGLGFFAAALLVGAAVWPPTLFAGSWLARLAWLNVVLGAFNLVPALPMDGGRMLRAFLARHRTRLDATVLASRVARYLGVAMILVGLAYDIWLVVIGVFVLLGANAEEEGARHPAARPASDATAPAPPASRDRGAHPVAR